MNEMHRIHKDAKKCNIDVSTYTCDQCKRIFKHEDDMNSHKMRVHEFGESFLIYPCEHCCFRGGDLRELENHIRDCNENK